MNFPARLLAMGAVLSMVAACRPSRPTPRYAYPSPPTWVAPPPAWPTADPAWPIVAVPPDATSLPPIASSAASPPASAAPSTSASASDPGKAVAWVDVQGGAVTGGAMPQLVAEMRGMLPDFRGCYLSALRTEPKMGGTLDIVANIATDGHITDAHVENDRGVSVPVGSCVIDTMLQHTFAHPSAQPSIVRVPISFSPSNKGAAK